MILGGISAHRPMSHFFDSTSKPRHKKGSINFILRLWPIFGHSERRVRISFFHCVSSENMLYSLYAKER